MNLVGETQSSVLRLCERTVSLDALSRIGYSAACVRSGFNYDRIRVTVHIHGSNTEECLRRSERRNAKAAEIASMKAASSSSQQHPSNSNPHRRFIHHSQSDHSTHPSHSSSHSSLGRGYLSTHPHYQQQRAHHGSAHGMPGPRQGAHHGDEDAPMSDGELDYPNALASG
ncbi:hypothetical protein BDN70DRAFT_998953 [Pholiota conissans]|uniref:Uncharacterized protein n=1 Tax=Pholiota conissans TaxID=109636 RepID=A0A9P5YMM2_9AGAR|nr:hypothetical protein BDN70DRAFT_998953 [Pholiota conissans]